jgi:hypothetical protein
VDTPIQGFLAGWPGLTNNEAHETWDRRLVFGLRFWLLAPLSLKVRLAMSGVLKGGYSFWRSVTPLAELGAGLDIGAPPATADASA